MNENSARYVTYGQWSLIVFTVVCVALHPGSVLKVNEGGFSNYGIHLKTAIPYTLTYALGAWFTFLAARSATPRNGTEKTMVRLLNAYAVLLLVIMFSTYGYTLNAPLKTLHGVVALVAMIFDPAAALWMIRFVKGSAWDRFFLFVVLLGLAMGVIDFLNVAHILFASEATIALGFGFVLVHTVHRFSLVAPRDVVRESRLTLVKRSFHSFGAPSTFFGRSAKN
jgi:hypothetical protein